MLWGSQHRIWAWTYEADIHCDDCARERFGYEALEDPDTEDAEGNPLHPVYSWDFERTEYCGDCHDLIFEYDDGSTEEEEEEEDYCLPDGPWDTEEGEEE